VGLGPPALRFLCRLVREHPLDGPVLTLGRQALVSSPRAIDRLLHAEGITPAAPITTATDVAFFRALGAPRVEALDVSAYEGAELVHDLNQPIPQAWAGQYALVVDGGTLEHVLDVRQALRNVAALVAVGGRVVHFSPSSNYADHGFYSFSPTLFHDHYAANGWDDVRVWVAEHDRTSPTAPWRLYAVPRGHATAKTSRHRLAAVAVATKTPTSSGDRIPVQAIYAAPPASVGRPRPLRRLWWWVAGSPVGPAARWLLHPLVPAVDRTRPPWGLGRPVRLR